LERSNTGAPHSPRQNRLLAALPAADYALLVPHLELTEMPLGSVIHEVGGKQSHVYFPTTAIVALMYITENGASAEVALTGNDGLVGIAVLMGGDTMANRAVVQGAGHAYRLPAAAIKQEFQRGGQLQHLGLCYTQALLTQMSQTAVCNRHHSVEQQLCRWLLLSLDRLPTNQMEMTQELIASMLGVRREGVTAAAKKLQAAGVIKYCRGRITILDRDALEQRVCECYGVVRREYDRLLPAAGGQDIRSVYGVPGILGRGAA
jgi:CRP-like cAMP-binding protein